MYYFANNNLQLIDYKYYNINQEAVFIWHSKGKTS
jgi:hypothetical protein